MRIEKYITIICSVLVFLLPIFFLPITTDYFELNKQILLIFFTLLLLFIHAVQVIQKKHFSFFATPFDLPLLVLTLLFILSTILRSPYKIGSLTAPLGTVSICILTLLYFILTQLEDRQSLFGKLKWSFFGFGLVLSGLVFLSSLGLIKTFTPAGTPYFTLIFLLIPLAYTLHQIPSLNPLTIFSLFLKLTPLKVAILIANLFITLALLLESITLLTGGLNFLPLRFGLTIAQVGLRSLPTLLLGTGPGLYINTFTLAKPIALNLTPYWNILFSTSSNYPLTLATEVGLPATLVFLILPILFIFVALKQHTIRKNPLFLPLCLLFLLQTISITNIALLTLTIILLAALTPRKQIPILKIENKTIIWSAAILTGITVSIFFILTGIFYTAEVVFKKSLDEAALNQGKQVYDLQLLAIRLNPYTDRYHTSFAQTNLALANSLSAQKNLTNEQKQLLPKLIQQSLLEGRYAVRLNPTSIIDWTNLGDIYRSLIHFAQGADSRSIETYQQIQKLSPNDPQSRLTLGNIYYSLGKLDLAETQFKEAIRLKPDWANAHFNLSLVEKQLNKLSEAKVELSITSQLLPPGSNDQQSVQKEMKNIDNMIATSSANGSK